MRAQRIFAVYFIYMQHPHFKNELVAIEKGFLAVGCDEVGRGPLAGPVVAAACVLDPESIGKYCSKNKWYARVRDSKMTSEEEREVLLEKILEHTLAHGLGIIWQDQIDKINIHNASLLAMRRAVEDLLSKLAHNTPSRSRRIVIFVDGRFTIPGLPNIEQKSIISGDAQVLSIAAASIIAKVHRDNIMKELHKKFPDYGFSRHKGYGTKQHKLAIKKHGITEVHRKSFMKVL